MSGSSEVILVAFHVDASATDAEFTRAEAMEYMYSAINHAGYTGPGELSFWIAEDDRTDRSDCDSAVFVHPGCQHMASKVLIQLDMSGECNQVDWRRSADSPFEGHQS